MIKFKFKVDFLKRSNIILLYKIILSILNYENLFLFKRIYQLILFISFLLNFLFFISLNILCLI